MEGLFYQHANAQRFMLPKVDWPVVSYGRLSGQGQSGAAGRLRMYCNSLRCFRDADIVTKRSDISQNGGVRIARARSAGDS